MSTAAIVYCIGLVLLLGSCYGAFRAHRLSRHLDNLQRRRGGR